VQAPKPLQPPGTYLLGFGKSMTNHWFIVVFLSIILLSKSSYDNVADLLLKVLVFYIEAHINEQYSMHFERIINVEQYYDNNTCIYRR
jgi:hypothetical protein